MRIENLNKEVDMAAIRGGSNSVTMVGATQIGGSNGVNIGGVQAQYAPQSVNQSETVLGINSVVGSYGTILGQFTA